MNAMRWLCVLVLTGAAAVAMAGDIQVVCEPGLRVYLDGAPVGTSGSRDDGLFLTNVARGAHIVRVEKDGFAPQSFQVEVGNLPVEVRVAEFAPKKVTRPGVAATEERPKKPTGNLLVTSAPQNCTVEIDGKTEVKSVPVLLIEGLTGGEHSIAFNKPGYDRISGVVKILPGAEVTVRGNLVAGKVETVFAGEGSLKVFSSPAHCTVRLLGKSHDTVSGVLNISHLPAGDQRIIVEWKGRQMSTTVLIGDRQKTVLKVSFMKGDQPFTVSYEPE